MKETEDTQVQEAYEVLLDSYKRSNHRQKIHLIDKAFKFANHAHRGAKRDSGEPYIMHPLAVALIVSEEIGLGSTSIVSALLHDVIEDTDYTVDDIKNLFGDKIAQIVNGLTKISGGIFAEAASAQAENMKKLLLTMSDDIRVVLIKIADRLHNMRTLGSLASAKQYKIAGETMYLYAPLAHRLGLFTIKTELEDLSFKYEHPEEYKQIEQKLEATAVNREKIYSNFATPLKNRLTQLGYRFKMRDRLKSIYSIWNKMKNKELAFEDIYDIFAARIVFEPKAGIEIKPQCWEIYTAVTHLYRLKPDRIRDWVTQPKTNGYQSLHVTVMGPDGQWIEVQIRSQQMDEVAEKGLAADWIYKGAMKQSELDHWLAKIYNVLEAPNPDAMDFLDTIKLNLYGAEIFVFTPKGEIKTLPQNATALDFAYEIHTNVGDHCIGAKANRKLVPLSHKLSSGDQVEILTSRSHHPQAEWLSFVTTAKAKTRIEASLRKQRRAKITEGEKLLTQILQKAGVEVTTSAMDKFCAYYGYSKREDLFYALSEKQIEIPENPKKVLKGKTENFLFSIVKQTFNMGSSSKEETEKKPTEKSKKKPEEQINRKKPYPLKEEDLQKKYLLQPCCHPIPGDDVFGYIRNDGRLEIHKLSCSPALKLKTSFGDRIVSCEWVGHKTFSFPATIELQGIDRMGMLSDIAQLITKDLSVNMRKLTLESKDGFFKGQIEVLIHGVNDINNLSSRLQKIKGIKSVMRITD